METDQPIRADKPMQDAPPTERLAMREQQLPQVSNVQREINHTPTSKSPHDGPSLHRSKWVQRAPQCWIELMYTEIKSQDIPGEIFSLSTLFLQDATMDMPNNPLLAFKATNSDPDTMYHHQAMHQPDRAQFIGAMQKEMDSQLDDGNFEIVHRSTIPTGSKILPAIWQMHQKHNIAMQQVKKRKAHLNFGWLLNEER